MKRFLQLLLITMMLGWMSNAFAQTAVQQSAQRLDAATFAVHGHAASTLTITPPAGNFVYITGLDISDCQTTTGVTAAAPTYITTTNITGSPQYQLGSGATTAPGTCQPTIALAWTVPLKSTVAGTAVTFVIPAFAANQVVSLNVYGYYNNL